MNDREEFDRLSKTVMGNFFDFNDADQDGKISQDEYVASMGSIPANQRSALEWGFQQLDTDGSGYLSREELLANIHDYCYSDDPNARGNWTFGPLE